MTSIVEILCSDGVAKPPSFLRGSVQYETITGSEAYGVADTAALSDRDVVGFCMPPKDTVFPHLRGEIPDFGRQTQRFNVWQQHHMQRQKGSSGSQDGDAMNYDVSIYSIVRFFSLCMDNNPNMVDTLFTPQRCVVHMTRLGERVRGARKLFLHKGSFHKFKGYAYSQLHKADSKDPEEGTKRAADRARTGMDSKFCYHVVRLMDEAQQILEEHDLDLERNREQLKSIRRGEWTMDRVREYFKYREAALEDAYNRSTLRHTPDEEGIKALLLECLESYYGDLSKAVTVVGGERAIIEQIAALCQRAVPRG